MPAIRPAVVDAPLSITTRITWPSDEWYSQLKRQATAATVDAAVRCARIEIDRLRRLNGAVDLDAEDLVQDILAATCAGTLKWCPDAAPLLTHLRDKVWLACRRLRRRLRGQPGTVAIALDELADEAPTWTDVEEALAAENTAPDQQLVDLGGRFEMELRRLAAADQVALLVLDQLAAGTIGIAEVVAATGLEARVVEGARKRLRRMARRISPDLLDEISKSL
jgi:hypothetical protein